MSSKVSICLPNLNSYKYLSERLDSIIAQTFHDWELIVVDSYSDDGSWELIQSYAENEPRMRIFQAPREGIYPGFNACIRHARGEFIYIATSDDTMGPNCLEQMVAALDQHQDCDICQCALQFIDESSQPLPPSRQWDTFGIGQYLDHHLYEIHKRYAPHDGLLHFAFGTVYTSITQILIRHSLFKKIGYFRTDLGSIADFEWEMKASLLSNTIYIPQTLATWRIHSEQATTDFYTTKNLRNVLRAANLAFTSAKAQDPEKLKGLRFKKLSENYKTILLYVGINQIKSLPGKILHFVTCFFEMPKISTKYLLNKVFRHQLSPQLNSVEWSRKQVKALKIESLEYLLAEKM